jgi:murein DD-endopeptidase MepM/ murein hydrolase activator NlpD
MQTMHPLIVQSVASLLAAVSAAQSPHLPSASAPTSIAHGGPVAHPPANPATDADCITPAERAAAESAVAAYLTLHPVAPSRTPAPLYPFWPQAGTWYRDLLPPGYVDQDPTSPNFHDYNCSNFTYDGHLGTDVGIRTFSEQAIGVPVFAALDGTVVFAHDGEPDMNTCLCGQTANAVIIDHGQGRHGWYWHFRTNSVAVTVGQHVVAGQQIGFAASSGNSGGPHLHFETRDHPPSGETVFDPFTGSCNPGPTGFINQPPLLLNTYANDFAFSTTNLSGLPPWPFDQPRTGQMAFDEYLWFWATIVNLPPHSAWRQYYLRPDGSTAFDSGDYLFEQDQTDTYRVSHWWWYSFYVNDMRTIPGVWHVRLDINGQTVINAPLTINPVRDPAFNRPPEPITLAFDPPAPRAPTDVLFCRLTTLTLDDLDYDLVRYTYVWTINNTEFRRLTSAAHADAIPRTAARPGDLVRCTVTPNDGHVDGPPATLTITMAGCRPDINADGAVNVADFLAFLAAYAAASPIADIDHSGQVNVADFLSFLQLYAAGC